MATFRFKQFEVIHEKSAMKVGTDGVLLGAWAEVENANNALDIGAGTGLISLMLAQRNNQLKVDAVEIDEASFYELNVNFKNSPWRNRLNAFLKDIINFKSEKSYDLIVSNPPFFDEGTKSPLDNRYAARHNQSLPQEALLNVVMDLLQPHGYFCIILPPHEGEKLITSCIYKGLFLAKKTHFVAKEGKKTERLLLQFTKKEASVEEGRIIQYESNNDWHIDYISLTRDFYLKL